MDLISTYKSLCTEFYDLDKPFASKEAMAYYLREIKKSVQPILEPMCGSGRFLIPVLEQGYDIDGTDASSEMLESCEKKCKDKNLTPVLYYQKMQELIVPRNYGLIFIPSGSFGLIVDDTDVRESLKRIHSCLIPQGQLIIEIFTPFSLSQEEKTNERKVSRNNSSTIRLTTKSHFDAKANIGVTFCEYQNIVNNCLMLTETETIKVRHYQIKEFTTLLKSTGFSEIKVLKPYTDERATEQDSMVLFKCTKQ